MLRTVSLTLTGLLFLNACALPKPVAQLDRELDEPPRGERLEAVHTDLIRGMLNQGQIYAALAHIQEQENVRGQRPELRLLKAEALSMQGDRDQAERLYQGLLRSPFAGEAHHGLGLLYAEIEPSTAVGHLQQAVRHRPTNPRFRNDLGYGLMRVGDFSQAQRELATAVELDPGSQRWQGNLIILYLLTGDQARARQWIATAGVDSATEAALRRQATRMRETLQSDPVSQRRAP